MTVIQFTCARWRTAAFVPVVLVGLAALVLTPMIAVAQASDTAMYAATAPITILTSADSPNSPSWSRTLSARGGQRYSINNGSSTPSALAPGEAVAIAADFGLRRAGTVATYFEIRDQDNAMVSFQTYIGQVFAAAEVRRYTWSFTLPSHLAPGTYRVDAAILTADSSAPLHVVGGLATFEVSGIVCSPPACRYFYVDSASGSDSNSGSSPTAPWKSLAKVNGFSLLPGDVINFKRGSVWTGNLQVRWSGTSTSPITYRAYGSGAPPQIRNPGVSYGSSVSVTGDWNIVQDFLLTDAHEAGVLIAAGADHNAVRDNEITATGFGVLARGQYNLLSGNEVHDLNMIVNDTASRNDYGAVCFWIEAPNNEVAYNRGINCRAPSYDFGHDGGFVEVWRSGDNAYIHHNYAQNTNGFFELGANNNGSARGIRVAYNVIVNVTAPGSGTSICFNTGAYTIAVGSFRFENNTFVSTSGHPDAFRIFGCRSDLTALQVRNNIFYSDIQIASNGSFTHTDNLYHMVDMVSGSGVGYGLGAGEMLGDPLFVDLGTGILRLLALSPAIDAGTDLGYGGDVEGITVPQGLAPDLGAFEFSLID